MMMKNMTCDQYTVLILQINPAYKGLTHLHLDKMAANLPRNIFKCIFSNENVI